MDTIDPGHSYLLDNLKSNNKTKFDFYKDPIIHGNGRDGPSCQEVYRMLIDRVQHLDSEKPHFVNDMIIRKTREIIALFEFRALLNKIKQGFAVENLPIREDGHWDFGPRNESEGDNKLLIALRAAHYYLDASVCEMEESNLKPEEALQVVRDLREEVDPLEIREEDGWIRKILGTFEERLNPRDSSK